MSGLFITRSRREEALTSNSAIRNPQSAFAQSLLTSAAARWMAAALVLFGTLSFGQENNAPIRFS